MRGLSAGHVSDTQDASHLRLVRGIYQYQWAIPKHLREVVAQITGKQLSPKERETGRTIAEQDWFIRSTGTGNLREAERVRDDPDNGIDATYRRIIKRAEAFSDVGAIAAAMNDAPNDLTFAQLRSLSQEQVGDVLSAIETRWARDQAHQDSVNDLFAEIRAALSDPEQFGRMRTNILGSIAQSAKLDRGTVEYESVIAAWAAFGRKRDQIVRYRTDADFGRC